MARNCLRQDDRRGDFRCSTYDYSTQEHLYIGVTGSLRRRVWQHKEHAVEGFTSKYDVTRLLYVESYHQVGNAIAREKQLKGWRREKKVALIEKNNPRWEDLSREWYVERRVRIVPPNSWRE